MGWRKSSRSGPNGGNCVECDEAGDKIKVRDSKHPEGEILSVSKPAMRAFFTAIQQDNLFGELTAEPQTFGNEIVVRRLSDGGIGVTTTDEETGELLFTEGEWVAFVADVLDEVEDKANFAGMVPKFSNEPAVA